MSLYCKEGHERFSSSFSCSLNSGLILGLSVSRGKADPSLGGTGCEKGREQGARLRLGLTARYLCLVFPRWHRAADILGTSQA